MEAALMNNNQRGRTMEDELEKWKEMETDCLVCIFNKLSLEDLTLGVPFVCKSWHKASLDPLCWRVLDFQEVDFMPWRKFGKRVASQYPHSPFSFSAFLRFTVQRSCGLATELRFPLFLQVFLEDLVYVSIECPRLKILVLRSLSLEDQVRLPEIVGKWKDLEHLEMTSNPSSFSELAMEISINCDKFSGLKMSGLRKEDALGIIKYLPKLKYLNLSRSYMPKETLLLIMNSCKDIEILIVKHCIGFEADEEVREMASRIRIFRHDRSRLDVDDSDYDSEEYFPFHMLPCDSDEYRIGIRCLP